MIQPSWPATEHPVWLEQITSLSRSTDREMRLSRLNAGNRFQLEQAELCRQMIVCYLVEVGAANVRDIAEALGITRQSVRDHLAKLCAAGSVKPTSTYPREWVVKQ